NYSALRETSDASDSTLAGSSNRRTSLEASARRPSMRRAVSSTAYRDATTLLPSSSCQRRVLASMSECTNATVPDGSRARHHRAPWVAAGQPRPPSPRSSRVASSTTGGPHAPVCTHEGLKAVALSFHVSLQLGRPHDDREARAQRRRRHARWQRPTTSSATS